jgi:hypothetical protein
MRKIFDITGMMRDSSSGVRFCLTPRIEASSPMAWPISALSASISDGSDFAGFTASTVAGFRSG